MSDQIYYVLHTDGNDTGVCKVVRGDDLRKSVHDLLCGCDGPWGQCDTESVTEAVRTLDDDDCWAHTEPGYQPFSWQFNTEDGYIGVVRLTEPLPVA